MNPFILAILTRIGLVPIPVSYSNQSQKKRQYQESDHHTVTDSGPHESSYLRRDTPGNENHF